MDSQPGSAVTPFDDGDLYDLVAGDLDYGLDLYMRLAKEAHGPVLDIGCGTGRVLLRCLAAGIEIDGVDLYPSMLDKLQRKAAEKGLTARVSQADMSDFRMPRQYALVMIPFNAFIHNVTQETQIRCLTLCCEHLLPGGLLAFDTFFPNPALVGTPEHPRAFEGEIKHPQTGRPVRMYDTRSFNHVEQTFRSITEIETEDEAGNVVTLQKSDFITRYSYKHEMALLLRLAGFERWEICGDFERKPLTKETDNMVVLAWKS